MTTLARRYAAMTGWRMFAIFISFFGIVFIVNFFMAYLAVSTFTGTVVDNSYVASQQFNGWLAEAHAEKALGWQTTVRLDSDRHIVVRVLDKTGRPLAPLDAKGTMAHMLVNAPPQALHFSPTDAGNVRSIERLPQGRWQTRLTLVSGTHQLRAAEDVK